VERHTADPSAHREPRVDVSDVPGLDACAPNAHHSPLFEVAAAWMLA